MSNNQLVEKETVEFINAFTHENATNYCTKCARPHLEKARINYRSIDSEIKQALYAYIDSFPLLTIENPKDWEYRVLGLVSFSKSVYGDFASRKDGQTICIQKIKDHTYDLGGNAIIGISIGYSHQEQGDFSSTQIINVYGTAILVSNTELFPDTYMHAKKVNEEFQISRDLIEKYREFYS